jgi:hypothetical protein
MRKKIVPMISGRSIRWFTNQYAAKNGKAVFTHDTGLEDQNRVTFVFNALPLTALP